MSELNVGNEVRRILMNELGLTREYVRGIVDDVVKEIVGKRLDAVNFQSYIDKIISSELNSLVRETSRYRSEDIRSYVQKAAQEQVSEFIKEHLHIKGK